jgi:hypothetical protein
MFQKLNIFVSKLFPTLRLEHSIQYWLLVVSWYDVNVSIDILSKLKLNILILFSVFTLCYVVRWNISGICKGTAVCIMKVVA